MKLENILLRAPGDTNVESGLQAKYEALIIRNNGDATASPDVYLSDFLEFQNEIVREANAGNVSAKSYNKWMFWSKVALEGFDPKAGWFDNNVAREKGVRKKLKVFLNDHSDKSSEWKIDAMREVYESLPAESLEMIGDDVAESLFKRGKAVAT
ncbi:hypothetical protein GWN42_05165, partial [candidate division KSB1 bacterium]|nr:hypothetical protein [Phycisphaerae bacterium]NIP54980.1 hypothetical protein [Phycisphaerae bacterium]NIV92194.1 hypothetical protein [candidate division KSB1 bacterium]NIX31049.1 hypothetical protein [Phycisphaerae bacterium]